MQFKKKNAEIKLSTQDITYILYCLNKRVESIDTYLANNIDISQEQVQEHLAHRLQIVELKRKLCYPEQTIASACIH
ncbi:hypothetical protein ACUR5C_01255 [Aliikangiella sp. IMCC44653]